MRCLPIAFLFAATLSAAACAARVSAPSAGVMVKFETTLGDFVLSLNAERAPVTVANFLQYVDSGFYKGTIWHRVIPGFMVQGGGFTVDMHEKTTNAPINLEMTGLKNVVGTVAMARTSDPNSATAQFFVNVHDNSFLNPTGPGNGYAVFGAVVAGMDTVEKIVAVQTTSRDGMQNVPVVPVVINGAFRVAEK
eukprot:TRINITY_DN432_c0_g1_i1.p2 TRINITY_DN432_c0_g1~~TRINITY_DN432_c0_g1_i1.p2  ORF type:complete len:193 (-),score=76.40 TRINITY_DN432_c0_g1_i1:2-580(-)